jgi:hypothetical protein
MVEFDVARRLDFYRVINVMIPQEARMAASMTDSAMSSPFIMVYGLR